ncbi:MAG: adenylyl-sulfate kinase [Planctomycetota bacterium]
MTAARDSNLTWHDGTVRRDHREQLLGQRGTVVWLTGLSGSGKSTLARALEERLTHDGRLAYVLDGDNIRHGLNADLGFSPTDRVENIRRIGEVAALFADAGLLVLVAFISPYRSDRASVRERVGAASFVEVHVDAALAVCEQRDPKGLYAKARAGEIADFTGVSASAPYEAPEQPDVRVNTGAMPLDACVARVLDHLRERGALGSAG